MKKMIRMNLACTMRCIEWWICGCCCCLNASLSTM